jgi:hypothetical protein
MAKPVKMFNSAMLATSAMTAFSYMFSYLLKNNTREPELLGEMIRRLFPVMSKPNARAGGWAAHYAVGLLFAELYGQIWERTAVKATVKSGLVFGGLSGIAAILIWKFTLETHPLAPAVDFKHFAINLLLAHLVFGIFAAIGYRRLPKGSSAARNHSCGET